MGRTKGVGILSTEDAIAMGVRLGPVLRASGVRWDLRKAQPDAAYDQYEFEIPTRTTGDMYKLPLRGAYGGNAAIAPDLPASD